MSAPEVVTRSVDTAVGCLRRGGLVGLPTETVYGLAADAEHVSAVTRIYATKGRPADHPLIVHVSGADALRPGPHAWVRDVPAYALGLAESLWPGSLTLVLRRTARAGDHLTGGQSTVALRVPAHPLALAVIAGLEALPGRSGAGLAAPSANRFGRVSPTSAADVLAEVGELLVPGVDCVLDGGPSRVGVESTIVDCTGAAPVILRCGAVSVQDVERVGGVAVGTRPRDGIRAPGMLASHYAPVARVVLAMDGDHAAALLAPGSPADGLLAPEGVPTPAGVVRLSAPADAAGYARDLYAALRRADMLGLRRVVAVPPGGQSGQVCAEHAGGAYTGATVTALEAAVRDRLTRASSRG